MLMYEGRDRAEWGRLSCLLATMCNLQRDPKTRPQPFTAAEFNPYEKTTKGLRLNSGNIDVLKQMVPSDSQDKNHRH